MIADASARTLSLPGVDVAERRGPAFTITISARYGTHPLLARASVDAALQACAKVLERFGLAVSL